MAKIKEKKNRFSNFFLGFLLLFVLLAAIFWIFHFNYEPQYGDTAEYWHLSKTLRVDTWRTLAYPLLLRLFSELFGKHSIVALYVFQSALSFLSLCYLFVTLDLTLGSKKGINIKTLCLSMILISFPIINHFNLTVLTDSVAASFLVLVISALIRIFLFDDLSKKTFSIAAISIASSVFLRSERFFYLLTLLSFIFLWNLLIKDKRKLTVILFFIGICFGANKVNQITQKNDLDRPKVSVVFAAFERTVQGNFVNLLPQMPRVIIDRISPELAFEWDKDPNMSIVIGAALSDQEGREAMIKGSIIALTNFAPEIAFKSLGDLVEYITAPFNYIRESIFPGKDPTAWTNTRMAGKKPFLTSIYQMLSHSILLICFFFSAINFLIVYKKNEVKKVFIFLGSVIFLFSLFFSLRTSLDFHIRYALPIYIIEVGTILWLSVNGPFDIISVLLEYLKPKPKAKVQTPLEEAVQLA
jgi:hypothetical protein